LVYLVSELGGEEGGHPAQDEDGDAQETVNPVEDGPPRILCKIMLLKVICKKKIVSFMKIHVYGGLTKYIFFTLQQNLMLSGE
jgi:hypothetical protein